ncbi:MAG: DUF983 domain-containing protein [Blastomonas fulva]|jgi:uncharacterized protein (DUF983 family)|uniref:DUF983 domain-containing protein n=1 Tax=Blastomonas TaxID=150203 RepID=UPI00258AB9DE|nr:MULTISPECIES: DUF983 domain-containing protein [Blastomonas]MCO5794122.1 DUF983 domain-containing protein [Blastomonas sp.]MDM7930069.1 DUF983 domain-containing protein [Blastomonas fulva]MDM7967432.1 DUF983 domain-containing protein [Blastomonas fulva]
MDDPQIQKGQSGLVQAALFGECPACGARTLFAGWVRFATRCRACGHDFSSYNVGDGPAAFLILVIGALVCALALVLQVRISPPFWVHILLWVPITSALVLLSLRVSKAAMLIHEARAEVREGKIADDTRLDP